MEKIIKYRKSHLQNVQRKRQGKQRITVTVKAQPEKQYSWLQNEAVLMAYLNDTSWLANQVHNYGYVFLRETVPQVTVIN